MTRAHLVRYVLLALTAVVLPSAAMAQNPCASVPSHQELKDTLTRIAVHEEMGDNGGFGLHMWGTVVNRDGMVCAVAFTGGERGDQWPGSRVISAQKASAANAFSLPALALSTANLYSLVQPGGSLFGLQESNPVDTDVAYRGNSKQYGRPNDPMVGGKVGGVNVFGGGLGLYRNGVLVGAIGVSGDTSCTDHVIAWRTRVLLGLDSTPNSDNIVFDIAPDAHQHPVSASGFGHPTCGAPVIVP